MYIANLIRGDQSSIPARHDSLTAEINAPTTADTLPRPAMSYGFEFAPTLLALPMLRLVLNVLHYPCHSHNGLSAKWALECSHLEPSLYAVLKIMQHPQFRFGNLFVRGQFAKLILSDSRVSSCQRFVRCFPFFPCLRDDRLFTSQPTVNLITL